MPYSSLYTFLGCLRGSMMKVYLAGEVNKNWVTSVFRLQVMIIGSLYVSVPFLLHLYFGT